jgi:hypothetical protein
MSAKTLEGIEREHLLNPSIPDEKAGHRSPQVEPTFQRPADNSAHLLRSNRFQAEGVAADYHHLLTFLDATCFGTGLAALCRRWLQRAVAQQRQSASG